jgi:hypothetical protein
MLRPGIDLHQYAFRNAGRALLSVFIIAESLTDRLAGDAFALSIGFVISGPRRRA